MDQRSPRGVGGGEVKAHGDCDNPIWLGERGNVAKMMFVNLTGKRKGRSHRPPQRIDTPQVWVPHGAANDVYDACTKWLRKRGLLHSQKGQ
jgi:hypothetical protein